MKNAYAPNGVVIIGVEAKQGGTVYIKPMSFRRTIFGRLKFDLTSTGIELKKPLTFCDGHWNRWSAKDLTLHNCRNIYLRKRHETLHP